MKKITFLLSILVAAALACNLPLRDIQTEESKLPIAPTADAIDIDGLIATAVSELNATGRFSMEFSEAQLTATLAQKLADEPNIPFSDPQVSLQDGQVSVTGKVGVGFVSTDAVITLEPSIDQGILDFTIVDARVGSAPLPDSVLNPIIQVLDDNLNELATISRYQIVLEEVTVADGKLVVSGRSN